MRAVKEKRGEKQRYVCTSMVKEKIMFSVAHRMERHCNGDKSDEKGGQRQELLECRERRECTMGCKKED